MAFPTTLPSFSDTDAAETLVNAGGGTGLSGFLDALAVDVTALGTKIGTGADTPVLNDVMVGTGTGTSGWSASLSGLTIAAPVLSGTVTGTYTLGGTPSMSGATLTAPVIATSLDMNGTELILDADADTSITADTDDQIDIKISAADDFRLVPNIFRALSGSVIETNTINETTAASGVTIDGVLIKDSTIQTEQAVTSTSAAVGFLVDHVISEVSTTATTTSIIAHDDTIPQNTEGVEITTVTITPKASTNILMINCVIMANSSATGATVALFRDSTADAIAAMATEGTDLNVLSVGTRVVAGSTSATTFKVRGGPGAAGTFRYNGAGGRYFGAITKSYLEVLEIKAV